MFAYLNYLIKSDQPLKIYQRVTRKTIYRNNMRKSLLYQLAMLALRKYLYTAYAYVLEVISSNQFTNYT